MSALYASDHGDDHRCIPIALAILDQGRITTLCIDLLVYPRQLLAELAARIATKIMEKYLKQQVVAMPEVDGE